MPMVNIREMRMVMLQLHMLVPMGMRLHAIPVEIMGVQVVRIVPVSMPMRELRVLMIRRMVLGEMQPDACRHQSRSNPKDGAGGLCEHGN